MITESEHIFLKLLRSTCTKEELAEDFSVSPENWKPVIALANRNQLVSFLYTSFNNLSGDHILSKEYIKSLYEKFLSYTFVNIKIQYALINLLEQFEANGLHPILFKGYIIAQAYPIPSSRISGDTDIFIPEEELNIATELLHTNGYTEKESCSKDKVPAFFNKSINHLIEIHTSLWENYTGTKIDLLNQLHMIDRANLIKVEIDGHLVTTLGYNEHLIYQLFHIIKHLFIESITFRYLIDITLYVNKYIEQLDIPSLWDNIVKLDYKPFAELLFTLCHDYLGMTDKVFLSFPTVSNESKEMLLHEFMYQSSVINNKGKHFQLLNIMAPYMTGDSVASNSKSKQILKILFPSPAGLGNQYSYAKKHTVLLPLAWIHKWIDFVLRRIFHSNTSASAKYKLEGTSAKMDLLSQIGLLKK